jgi:hypothetical protein
MIQKFAAMALAAFALGGCALLPKEEPLPPQPGADQVMLTKEQNGRFLAFVGPRQQHTQPFLGVDDTNYYALRSWLDTKTGEVAHQLYVADSYYGSPYDWNAAQTGDNKALRFIPISRNEITCDLGCAYFDEFAAALPEDVMRAHRDSGLSVTFSAKDGKRLLVTVPARMIAEELTAVDQTRAALAANTQKGAQPAPATAPPPAAAATPAPAAAPRAPAPAGTVVPAPTPAATSPPAPSAR